MILSRMEGRDTVEFARIAAFTDGVFAIAITLLVLSLNVPEGVTDAELHDYLLDSWRQLFAYFLSFAVIGRFWIAHHRFFALLGSFDRRLLVLTLVYLSMIVLIPFPTELLGDYGNESDAVILYAAVVGTAALLGWVMLRHTVEHEHVRPGMEANARDFMAGALPPAIVFYLSIPVAIVSPEIGQLCWLALLAGAFRRRR
jgi:uncharacterized membrane protein